MSPISLFLVVELHIITLMFLIDWHLHINIEKVAGNTSSKKNKSRHLFFLTEVVSTCCYVHVHVVWEVLT